jgi:hypothetical protein
MDLPIGRPARQVDVFITILAYHLLTYLESTHSQSKEDFISACENTVK